MLSYAIVLFYTASYKFSCLNYFLHFNQPLTGLSTLQVSKANCYENKKACLSCFTHIYTKTLQSGGDLWAAFRYVSKIGKSKGKKKWKRVEHKTWLTTVWIRWVIYSIMSGWTFPHSLEQRCELFLRWKAACNPVCSCNRVLVEYFISSGTEMWLKR